MEDKIIDEVAYSPAGDGSEVEVEVNYRTEGAAIGDLSLLSGDRSRMNITAAKDTVFYLVPREFFLELLERRPDVHEFFTRAFLAPYLDKAFGDTRAGSIACGDSEQLLFSTTAGQLPTREPVTAPPGTSIRDAAGISDRQEPPPPSAS